jgi:hypothetical protein
MCASARMGWFAFQGRCTFPQNAHSATASSRPATTSSRPVTASPRSDDPSPCLETPPPEPIALRRFPIPPRCIATSDLAARITRHPVLNIPNRLRVAGSRCSTTPDREPVIPHRERVTSNGVLDAPDASSRKDTRAPDNPDRRCEATGPVPGIPDRLREFPQRDSAASDGRRAFAGRHPATPNARLARTSPHRGIADGGSGTVRAG